MGTPKKRGPYKLMAVMEIFYKKTELRKHVREVTSPSAFIPHPQCLST
jgi:hypothetical protein